MPSAAVRSGTIQREVKELFDVDEEVYEYYSSLDPRPRYFSSFYQAQALDQVLTEYQRLDTLVRAPLGNASRDDLARLQRIRLGHFNSWVPVELHTDSRLKSVHDALVFLKGQRNFTVSEASIWYSDLSTFKTWAQTLVADGYPQAADVYQSLEKLVLASKDGQAAGYKYQLFRHMTQRAEYQLVSIEPEYGIAKVSTGYHPRGDAKVVVSSTQEAQSSYYGAPLEDRKTLMVDSKVGYKDESKYQQPFFQEFQQYGGTAMDSGVAYGGIDQTQSSQPGLMYDFYRQQVPDWIPKKMPEKGLESRSKKPTAFPGGLYLGPKEVLPPLSTKTYREGQMAEKVVNKLFQVAQDNDILAQPSFVSWDEWTGDFRSWVRHVATSLSNYLDADILMKAAMM